MTRLQRCCGLLLVVGVAFHLACAPVPVETPAAPPPPAPTGDLDLKAAAEYLARDLAGQIGAAAPGRVAVDPLLDKVSGQQTGASVRLQDELIEALRGGLPGATVEVLGIGSVDQAGLVATGTVGPGTGPDFYVAQVALTNRTSGIVVAQSAVRFREGGLDQAPTAFYSDSPSLVRDRSVDAYLRTAEAPPGTLADPLYVEQLPTAALIAEALDEYNDGNWDLALAGYEAAASRQGGQTLRTFNGLYLTNVRLGRLAAAEEAFGRIVALGLATNNLAMKLLFVPGTTDFLPDPNISGVYPMWIRQIARAASAADNCLHITGHTSASGTVAVNDRLSLARATAVQSLLIGEVPALRERTRVSGLGSSRNHVGTGADDASDAIDRRVEFEVEPCAR